MLLPPPHSQKTHLSSSHSSTADISDQLQCSCQQVWPALELECLDAQVPTCAELLPGLQSTQLHRRLLRPRAPKSLWVQQHQAALAHAALSQQRQHYPHWAHHWATCKQCLCAVGGVCVCVRLCVQLCMCVHRVSVCMCVCVFSCVYVCIFACLHVCMCVLHLCVLHVGVRMLLCVCTHVCLCVCVHMCVCVCL